MSVSLKFFFFAQGSHLQVFFDLVHEVWIHLETYNSTYKQFFYTQKNVFSITFYTKKSCVKMKFLLKINFYHEIHDIFYILILLFYVCL